MRYVLAVSLVLLPAMACAQAFSPLSGPNTAIPSPVCDLVNFGFCPQPPSPPPLLPDAKADATPPPVRPVAVARHHRLHRRVHRH